MMSLLLIKFFDDYVVEVKRHMDYENDVIFKYVENLLKGDVDENSVLMTSQEITVIL